MTIRETAAPAGRPALRRWLAWGLSGAVAIACGCAAAYPWVTGRARPPVVAREVATSALERARDGHAREWSPEMLARAETTLESAVEEEQRQRDRFFVWRNFADARGGFDLATDQALRADRDGDTAWADARDRAEAALIAAEGVVGEADSLLDDVPLGRSERAALRQAKTQLQMGRALWQDDAWVATSEHAERAVERARAALAGAGSMASRFTDGEQVRRWRRWVDETIAWSRRQGATAVVVYKEMNRLELYSNGRLVRSYRADMGSNNTRTKLVAGDQATPEGRYRITAKKDTGHSVYYKALLLDYPNDEDRKRFRELVRQGRISSKASIGGLIEIHGEGGRGNDWTRGCVALSNSDMDHLFSRTRVDTPVTIVGGDGKSGRLSQLARRLSSGAAGGATP